MLYRVNTFLQARHLYDFEGLLLCAARHVDPVDFYDSVVSLQTTVRVRHRTGNLRNKDFLCI